MNTMLIFLLALGVGILCLIFFALLLICRSVTSFNNNFAKYIKYKITGQW
jgi:hypothetical protein